MRRFLVAALALLAFAPRLGAQAHPHQRAFEIRPLIGTVIPLGAMAAEFETRPLVGAQLAGELTSQFHLVASVGWSYGHNSFLDPSVTQIWAYDIGAEANLVRRPVRRFWEFAPFAGIGAGGRTYTYAVRDAGPCSSPVGYLALGGELRTVDVGIRAESRTHFTPFHSPLTGRTVARRDLSVSIGIAYHLW